MAGDIIIVSPQWQQAAEQGERVQGAWVLRNVGTQEATGRVVLTPPAGVVFDEGPPYQMVLVGEEVQHWMSFTMPGRDVQFTAQAQTLGYLWYNTGNPRTVSIALAAAPVLTPEADIIAVNFPATAMEGAYVSGTVELRNIGQVAGMLSVGVDNPSGVVFDLPARAWVQPNASATFLLGFTMPNVFLFATARAYHDEGVVLLVLDDSAALNVGLTKMTGKATGLEIAYSRVASDPAAAGVWLDPSDWVAPQVWHTYEGPTVGVVEALAPIAGRYGAIHHYNWDTGAWTQYDGPGGAYDTLTTVQNGQKYIVQVTERCFWSW